jgi:hypothetical protein
LIEVRLAGVVVVNSKAAGLAPGCARFQACIT